MNHTRKNLFTIILCLMIGTVINYAQDKIALNVKEAIELGLAKNKNLRISEAKVRYSKAKLDESFTARYGWLKFSASYTRLSEVDPFQIMMPFGTFVVSPSILNNYQTKLTVAQPLFTGFKLDAASEIADLTLASSQSDYQKDQSELIMTIKNAYWSLYKANEMRKMLDDNMNQVKAHLKDAENLLNQGMLTRNDILKIKLQLSDIMYKQSETDNAVKMAKLALNNAMGIKLNTDIELTEPARTMQESLPELPVLIDRAIDARPEIAAAKQRIGMSRSGVTVAKSNYYPQVAVVGNYTFAQPNQRIVPTKDQFKGTWDISLALNYDIWDWDSRGIQTQEAEIQLMQAQEALEIAKDGITLEVTQNYLAVRQANERIGISMQTKEQAEENLRITSEKFKQGMALSSDLVDAETAVILANTNYTTSVADYEIALARLQRSTGAEK